MKIVVTGTRGIPGIQGGVETHCEELYPRLAALGHDVTVIRRSCYVTNANRVKLFRGVKLVNVYAPRIKSLEAIFHTFCAVIKAKTLHPDILHIHAIGPSIMVPFARLLGMKVVMTHHGADYERGKWGKLAKAVLRLGEKWGVRKADAVISISQVISDSLANLYGRTDTNLIYNGVTPPSPSAATDYIDSLGLKPRKYVVALGRFVKEKNFDLLIDAFDRSELYNKGYRLVIAGDADHPNAYSESLKNMANVTETVLTGFIKGERLNQLMSHAALFVLPSSHEGLPISLLEAMSYGLDVLVSDIPANRLPQLDAAADFVPVNNRDALRDALIRKLSAPSNLPRKFDLTDYNWDRIALKTLQVYNKLL